MFIGRRRIVGLASIIPITIGLLFFVFIGIAIVMDQPRDVFTWITSIFISVIIPVVFFPIYRSAALRVTSGVALQQGYRRAEIVTRPSYFELVRTYNGAGPSFLAPALHKEGEEETTELHTLGMYAFTKRGKRRAQLAVDTLNSWLDQGQP